MKRIALAKSAPASAAAKIDCKIAQLDDWRGETYKSAVKLTFAKGAALPDPSSLFNSSLDGNVRRAIDIHEGEKINEAAFKALIRAPSPSTFRAKARRSPAVRIDRH